MECLNLTKPKWIRTFNHFESQSMELDLFFSSWVIDIFPLCALTEINGEIVPGNPVRFGTNGKSCKNVIFTRNRIFLRKSTKISLDFNSFQISPGFTRPFHHLFLSVWLSRLNNSAWTNWIIDWVSAHFRIV